MCIISIEYLTFLWLYCNVPINTIIIRRHPLLRAVGPKPGWISGATLSLHGVFSDILPGSGSSITQDGRSPLIPAISRHSILLLQSSNECDHLRGAPLPPRGLDLPGQETRVWSLLCPLCCW